MWGSMNSGSMVLSNLLDIQTLEKKRLRNSIIYFVVFFVKALNGMNAADRAA